MTLDLMLKPGRWSQSFWLCVDQSLALLLHMLVSVMMMLLNEGMLLKCFSWSISNIDASHVSSWAQCLELFAMSSLDMVQPQVAREKCVYIL